MIFMAAQFFSPKLSFFVMFFQAFWVYKQSHS